MRNFGAQYLYVQFLTNKHYSGCFAFNVSIGEKGKKITIELNFGENEMSAFQRKMTEFDTRSKKLMSSLVFRIVARSFIIGILLLFSGSA